MVTDLYYYENNKYISTNDTTLDKLYLTISDDPDIVYPKYFNVRHIKRFNKLPFLKGCETLEIEYITHSLDCTDSGIKHLKINRMQFYDKEDENIKYDDFYFLNNKAIECFPLGYFQDPITISCPMIEIDFIHSSIIKDGSRGLNFECNSLIISKGKGGFTSSCKVLCMKPNFRFTDNVQFHTPNLQFSCLYNDK